jgi:hypothetical protein
MKECTCNEEWDGPTLNNHADDCPWHEEPSPVFWLDGQTSHEPQGQAEAGSEPQEGSGGRQEVQPQGREERADKVVGWS